MDYEYWVQAETASGNVKVFGPYATENEAYLVNLEQVETGLYANVLIGKTLKSDGANG